jgi:hypothetical protein
MRRALLVLLAACSTGPAAGADAGRDAQDAAAVAPVFGALACADLVTCAGACASTDDACLSRCALRTPEATNLANELLHCLDAHACTEAACVRTSCAMETTACLLDGAARLAPQGAPGPGAVPAEYVGTWSSPATRWTIGASGSVLRRRTIAARGCNASLEESGVALQLNERLVVSYSTGTLDVCGAQATPKPFEEQYEHSIAPDGTALVLLDLACTGPVDGCTSRFPK